MLQAPAGRPWEPDAEPAGGHKGGVGVGQQPPESNQRPGGTHKQGESARRANKTNNTQRQGTGHPGPETKQSKRQRGRAENNNEENEGKRAEQEEGGESKQRTKKGATPAQRGSRKVERPKGPKEKVRRTRPRPGGRPARPGQDGRAHALTHGTRAGRPPTRKGRCWRPHETAPVHWPSPPSNDGQYGRPDASVTESTHANHRSARSPRPTPEGPARDNPVAGPRTGTTRSEPSAPPAAGASGRHNEPGSWPASACPAQPPSKAPPGWGKAPRRRRSQPEHPELPDRTRRGAPRGATRHGREARRRPQPRHTDRCQAATAAGCRKPGEHAQHATNHGTRTGAKQRQPPSKRTCARSAANPDPAGYGTAAVQMDACAPGGYPAPAGYQQLPSGWTSERPAATLRTRNPQHNTPSEHTGKQEPSGPGHRTARRTRTGEQESSGPGHRTRKGTHRAGTAVNRSQVARDTAHATQQTKRAHR